MTIDFFVHPDLPFEDTRGRYNPRTYQEYFENLLERWDSSDEPVLIEGIKGHERFLEKVKKDGSKIKSCSFLLHDMPSFEYGEVRPIHWKRFTELVDNHKNEEIKVHGCYYGKCAEGFAVQLLAYVSLGEHWHDWWGLSQNNDSIIKKNIKKEKAKRIELEKKGEYVKSNIRYGLVHLSRLKDVKAIPPTNILNFWRRRPYGNITYQLTDEKTMIIRPEF